ncbi:hypothetical protein ACSLVN_27340, partial [Klebsiella pneumoniae]|uniref:hypothetical protein n=1 Tax=Klebsiella pneumoniae TaxID=573 RepID=UPI003EE422DF
IRITTYENGNVLFRLHYNAFLYDLLKLDSLLELQQYTGFYCSEREIDDILIRAIDGKIYCATLGIDYNSTNTHSELWEFAECDIQAVNDVSYAFL